MVAQQALVLFKCGTLELQPTAPTLLKVAYTARHVFGQFVRVLSGPETDVPHSNVYTAEFSEAPDTLQLPPVTERDAFTTCQIQAEVTVTYK